MRGMCDFFFTCLTGLMLGTTVDSFRTWSVFLGPKIELRGEGKQI